MLLSKYVSCSLSSLYKRAALLLFCSICFVNQINLLHLLKPQICVRFTGCELLIELTI